MADLRVPPGRAGRLWLGDRLRTARRAATLLDHKLHVLRSEQERLALIAARTGTQWSAAQRTAELWLTRAAVLGGQRDIRLGAAEQLAEVTVTWETVLGVRYPGEAVCALPTESPEVRSPDSAALVEATAAHRDALQAAVRHAAATAACRILETETVQTRQRLHAITDRWIPRLESALHQLVDQLDEAERAEAVRLRWTVGRVGSPGAR